jgi:hypothetical protein
VLDRGAQHVVAIDADLSGDRPEEGRHRLDAVDTPSVTALDLSY